MIKMKQYRLLHFLLVGSILLLEYKKIPKVVSLC